MPDPVNTDKQGHCHVKNLPFGLKIRHGKMRVIDGEKRRKIDI